MTTHRSWSAEEKFRIVLEGLSPKANVAEICRAHSITSGQFYKWRERALASMKTGLKSGEGTVEQGLRQENRRLKRLVADQALALQVFRDEFEGSSEGKKRRRGIAMKMVERGIPTARAANFTGLSRRAMYLAPTPEPVLRPRADEPQVRQAIREVAPVRPAFGYRRVWPMLRRSGRTVNRKRVHRLMKAEGLLKPAHFPRPRLPSTGSLSAELPNRKWSTDLTDVLTTDRGICHLMAVVDACTREVVVWEVFPSCAAADALSLVEKALWARFPSTGRATELVLKTDAGSQFNSRLFREGVRTQGIHLDMSHPQTPEDNGLQESFHGHLKGDYLWLREAESFLETRATTATSIKDYNEFRPHSSLKYMTPKEYAQKKQEEQQA